MAEKNKDDTEESDLDDYLDDDDADIDAKWIEEQLEEDIRSEIIDIKEPLKSIRESLGVKLLIDLSDCEFSLEGSEKLDPESTLAEFCEKDEGLIEIDYQIKENYKECGEKTCIIDIVNVVEPRDNLEIKTESETDNTQFYSERTENIAEYYEPIAGTSRQRTVNSKEIRKTIKRPTVILGKAKSTNLVSADRYLDLNKVLDRSQV